MNITKGIRPTPPKVVIYGQEGIGKSTLAGRFPSPLFLDIEGGTSRLDVERLDITPSFATVKATLTEILKGGISGYKTLVIDTADKLDGLIMEAVCSEASKNGIEDFGYGKGYTYVEERWAKLLDGLDQLQKQTGMGIVFIAHSTLRKIEEPGEIGSFDHYELKLTKKSSAMLKEWADFLLFLKYDVYVEKDASGKTRTSGGVRRVHTQHTTLFDAKSRASLPESLALDDAGLKTLFGGIYPTALSAPAPAKPEPAATPEPPLTPAEQVAENAGCNNESAPLCELVEVFPGQRELIRKIDDALTIEGLTREDLYRVTVAVKMRPAGTKLEMFSEPDLLRILGGWAAVSKNCHKLKGDR